MIRVDKIQMYVFVKIQKHTIKFPHMLNSIPEGRLKEKSLVVKLLGKFCVSAVTSVWLRLSQAAMLWSCPSLTLAKNYNVIC